MKKLILLLILTMVFILSGCNDDKGLQEIDAETLETYLIDNATEVYPNHNDVYEEVLTLYEVSLEDGKYKIGGQFGDHKSVIISINETYENGEELHIAYMFEINNFEQSIYSINYITDTDLFIDGNFSMGDPYSESINPRTYLEDITLDFNVFGPNQLTQTELEFLTAECIRLTEELIAYFEDFYKEEFNAEFK